MNAASMRDLTVAELKTWMSEQRRALWKKRVSLASGQLEKTHAVREARRAIARAQTIIAEKQRA
mgnify:CR=1 FL=1